MYFRGKPVLNGVVDLLQVHVVSDELIHHYLLVQGEVHSSVGHLGQHLAHGLTVILGVHEVGRPEHLGLLELIRIDVNGKDPLGSCGLAAHDRSQAHSSQTEHGTHPTAKETDFVQRGSGVDLSHSHLVHNSVLREGHCCPALDDLQGSGIWSYRELLSQFSRDLLLALDLLICANFPQLRKSI
ncbi:hypothetical protein EYF80_028815 [Liparis tanakae]|uniref:Uncharacterized protein n=1 Tax=Liparis tanakae TaxID=230148 RepID=A0A4Z2H6R1_9TELE|nr:hypothetical protein EYF80_028815 [Liparis tanakae]